MATQTVARIYVFPRSHAAPPVPSRAMERLGRAALAAESVAYAAAALLVAGTAAGRPLSSLWLGLLSAGLSLYVVWRLAQAVVDSEHHGRDRAGVLRRAVYLGSALSHGAVAFVAAGWAEDARRVESWTWGSPAVVALAGAALFGFGLYHFRQAHAATFMKDYEFAAMSMHRRAWALRLGQIGIAGRGVALIVTAWLLLRLAETLEETTVLGFAALWEGRGVESAIGWSLVAAAAGFAAYAGYCASAAVHRRFDRRR
jgi:hypothetical protein